MSETTSWTDHVLDRRAWLRFLFMLLFTPLLGCVGFMLLCVALFQFFSVLANGEDNAQLRALGADLNRLGVDIVAFLTYNTERKPFPFRGCAPDKTAPEATEPAGSSADRQSENTEQGDSRPAGATASKSTSRRKTTTRKTAARKKATRRKRSSRSRTPPHAGGDTGRTSADIPGDADPSSTDESSP